jgi:hypothetical protein
MMFNLSTLPRTTTVEAHKAGMAYWRMNRPHDATREGLASHARSCGCHDEDIVAWLAGFYGAKRRDISKAKMQEYAAKAYGERH